MDARLIEQRSDAWFAFRAGKVSASRVKDVMAQTKSGPSASRKNYMMELLCERLTGTRNEGFTSKEMQRGTDLEPVARSAYEIDQGVMTVEVGSIQHPIIEGFIASPDALVGDSGLLEIKCPNTANHIAVIQSGKHDPQYEWQMLAQMACTGRAWVDFVSFDDRLPEPLQYARRRFHFDVARVQEMETEIRKFLDELAELEAEMRQRMAA